MTADNLAVIDCSGIAGSLEDVENTEAFKKFTKELGDGMSGIGFVYFVNHGLASSTVETLHEKFQKFYKLPMELKRKYEKLEPLKNFHGYTAPGDEALNNEISKNSLVIDIKESFDVHGPDGMDESKYPVEVPGIKAAADEFKESLNGLAKKIFRAFAVYLKLDDPDFFIKKHLAIDNPKEIQSHTVFRSNYYMAVGNEVNIGPESMRLGAHNDWGSITFLSQDSAGGLEAKHLNGTWISVPPIPESLVLNAGLMLEMWSGGHFPATAHRVRLLKENAGNVRQSVGYFLQPDGNCNCVPVVPEKENWESMYPKMDKKTVFEYFLDRVRGTRELTEAEWHLKEINYTEIVLHY